MNKIRYSVYVALLLAILVPAFCLDSSRPGETEGTEAKEPSKKDSITYISTREELDKILKENDLVLVTFSASWCGPCVMMAPELRRLASEDKKLVKVVKVDFDGPAGLLMDFRITAVPTTLAFKKGEFQGRAMGYMSYEELKKITLEIKNKDDEKFAPVSPVKED